jgi:hypothetical protein
LDFQLKRGEMMNSNFISTLEKVNIYSSFPLTLWIVSSKLGCGPAFMLKILSLSFVYVKKVFFIFGE